MARKRFTVALALLAVMCTGFSDHVPATAEEGSRVACRRDSTGNNICFAPVLQVTSSGLTPTQADSLVQSLGLSGRIPRGTSPLGPDGVFRFLDPQRFEMFPESILTVDPQVDQPNGELIPHGTPLLGERGESPAGVDLINLAAVGFELLRGNNTVVGAEQASNFVAGALGQAGAVPPGAVPRVTHGKVEFMHNVNSRVPAFPGLPNGAEWLLDTQVGYDVSLGGIPIRGPGFNVSVTLDPSGVVSQAQIATRGFTDGPLMRIIDPATATDVCRARLGAARTTTVTAELVYYAPPLSESSAMIVPSFACSVVPVQGSSETAPLDQFLPAVLDVPAITLEPFVEGNQVSARATVTGGTAPYRYTWSSSSMGELSSTTSRAFYSVVADSAKYARAGLTPPALLDETLTLIVTDANGLVVPAAAVMTVALGTQTAAPAPLPADDGIFGHGSGGSHPYGGIEVGAEGGTSSPDCAPYVSGFRNATNMSPDSRPSVRFVYTTQYAWSSDFKSSSISGGNDHSFADDVDMVFYCGHGWPDGFTFQNTTGPTDLNVTYDEAQWGDRDLEWLALLSCQVLASSNGTLNWAQRWGGAFQGLHEMLGFHTNASASGNLGGSLAFYVHGGCCGMDMAPYKVHDAWVQAVKDGQPAGRVWATILPVSNAGAWNRNDYFWNRGPTYDDIPASQINYFLRYSGTV